MCYDWKPRPRPRRGNPSAQQNPLCLSISPVGPLSTKPLTLNRRRPKNTEANTVRPKPSCPVLISVNTYQSWPPGQIAFPSYGRCVSTLTVVTVDATTYYTPAQLNCLAGKPMPPSSVAKLVVTPGPRLVRSYLTVKKTGTRVVSPMP